MADIKSPEERSRNMAKIRSKDTKPEVWFRKKLFARGYRYRKNVSYIPGHPDLWLAKYNTAIFVHGCFWHRHGGCKFAYMPKSRVEFWEKKFARNAERDAEVRQMLREQGYRVLIVWECTVKQMMRDGDVEAAVLEAVREFLGSDDGNLEV